MDNELKHFGVPGMKWGVRKEQYKQLNRQQKRQVKDYAKLRKQKQVRAQLEKRHKELEKTLNLKIDNKALVTQYNKEKRLKQAAAAIAGILGIAAGTAAYISRQKRMSKKDIGSLPISRIDIPKLSIDRTEIARLPIGRARI
jgi:hypothetical protein